MSGRRSKGRGLNPDERRLWDSVARTVDLRPSAKLPKGTDPDPDPAPRKNGAAGPGDLASSARDHAPTPSLPRKPLALGRTVAPPVKISFAPEDAGPVGKPQAGLDRRTADRLRKGARDPDARIDLHGMTADRAHLACLRFLGDAVARGHRVVLVITGKGAGRDRDGYARKGGGVLRESLPGWLRASPLALSIVGIFQAHQKHGGAGAFYVYLKKRR